MYCAYCGSKIDDEAIFCTECGKKQPELPARSVAEAAPAANASQTAETSPATAANTSANTSTNNVGRKLPSQYKSIYVMEYGDHVWPFVYPSIDENGRMLSESADHGFGTSHLVRAIKVSRMKKDENDYQEVLRASDIKMDFYITDARVALICDQYDRGGKWYGGLSALALNAIERGIANARTKGKTLAGHVRYEWIKHIMYMRKSGFLSDESVRIVYSDRESSQWQVQLTLDKYENSAALANEIMHKAARLRSELINNGEIPASSIEFYKEHAKESVTIPYNPEKNKYSYVVFPENYRAPTGEGLNREWK